MIESAVQTPTLIQTVEVSDCLGDLNADRMQASLVAMRTGRWRELT